MRLWRPFRGVKSSQGGGIATVISVITLIIGATGMFGQLQDAMNTIWGSRTEGRDNLDGNTCARGCSPSALGFPMAMGALLLASMLLSAYLAAASPYFYNMLPMTGHIWPLVDFGVSFVILTLLFAR